MHRSLELVPGKKYEIVAAADLHITNAALGDELDEETGRSVIKATVHEQPAQLDSDSEDEAGEAGEPFDTVLCSLRAGQVRYRLRLVTVRVLIGEEDGADYAGPRFPYWPEARVPGDRQEQGLSPRELHRYV